MTTEARNNPTDTLVSFNERLVSGELPVKPGQREVWPQAASSTDVGRQGDMYFREIAADPRIEYSPAAPHRQLVPGNTKGSKHSLAHLDGVEMWHPRGFTMLESYDGHLGPVVSIKAPNQIEHPEHGTIVFEHDVTIQIGYQKSWSAEEARIRRQLD